MSAAASFGVWFSQKTSELNTEVCHQIASQSSRFGSEQAFMSISVSLLEGTHGENKINGFNFILANQIPIKLKEKLNSGQSEH